MSRARKFLELFLFIPEKWENYFTLSSTDCFNKNWKIIECNRKPEIICVYHGHRIES